MTQSAPPRKFETLPGVQRAQCRHLHALMHRIMQRAPEWLVVNGDALSTPPTLVLTVDGVDRAHVIAGTRCFWWRDPRQRIASVAHTPKAARLIIKALTRLRREQPRNGGRWTA